MLEFLKIAWRNIWRNKRRSIITMSSIFFATFLAIIMRSFQLGSYDAMINTMIEKYTGYIQIENPDFPEEPIIDNTIEYSEEIINKIQSVENVKGVAPRITFFSQAYSDVQNKGVFLMGIDPELENDMTKFSDQIAQYKLSEEAVQNITKEGIPEYISEALVGYTDKYYSNAEILSFDLDIEDDDLDVYLPMILKHAAYESNNLSDNDDGVLLGSGLANYLELSVGDSIVLMGLGYHGSSAAAVFPVKGIIVIPNPQLDGRVVYGSLQNIQSYFSAYSYDEDGNQIAQLSTYGINLHKTDYKDVEKTRDEIIAAIGRDDMLVRGWKEANKELNNQIESDNKSGQVMIGLLYIVIAFGVFGTVLMMIAERKREMGVMIAVGMKKIRLGIIITLEMIFMSFLGLFVGILGSIPIVIVGHLNPIRLRGEAAEMMATYGMEPVLPFAWFDLYYLNQLMVVAIIVLVVMVYPVIKISRMKVIEALRA